MHRFAWHGSCIWSRNIQWIQPWDRWRLLSLLWTFYAGVLAEESDFSGSESAVFFLSRNEDVSWSWISCHDVSTSFLQFSALIQEEDEPSSIIEVMATRKMDSWKMSWQFCSFWGVLEFDLLIFWSSYSCQVILLDKNLGTWCCKHMYCSRIDISGCRCMLKLRVFKSAQWYWSNPPKSPMVFFATPRPGARVWSRASTGLRQCNTPGGDWHPEVDPINSN